MKLFLQRAITSSPAWDRKLMVLGLLDLVSISHEEQPPPNLSLTSKYTLLFTMVEIHRLLTGKKIFLELSPK